MEYEKDLMSIQEARNLMKTSKIAQKTLANYTQQEIDKLVKAICDACVEKAEPLAKMAYEETGFGIWQDKTIKNLLGSKMVYETIKDLKTIGIIKEDKENKIIEVAVPVGVVVALIPSTNPTSTVIYKVLISLKAGNSIVVSPHPNASKCIIEAVRIMEKAARKVGAPEGIIQVMTNPTLQATDTLMKHKDTGVILATGGEAMVKAAYSSGNPALGVGPGNGPAVIEKSADIKKAAKQIVDSKTFDNGTLCASEQSVITQNCIKEHVIEELKKQHCYFMAKEEAEKVEKFIMRANNTMNPQIVGKSAKTIAKMAQINIPEGTKVLIAEQAEVGKTHPYSREKLCPILGFYTTETWEEACQKSMEILQNEGSGHTMTIHTQDENIVRAFAMKKPVSRLLVNTPASLGGVGASTNLIPALTLGCGAVGGSATSDNIGPMNLINIRRVAYGVKEIEELRGEKQVFSNCEGKDEKTYSHTEIEEITREVLKNILNQG